MFTRKNDVKIDLKEVVDDLNERDITAPVLLRFPDILDNRIEKTSECFNIAAKEYNFQAEHFIIFPIKVNQMRLLWRRLSARQEVQPRIGGRFKAQNFTL